MKIKFIILFFISFIFSYENTWSTTRFEYWWNSKINKSLFRESIKFLPYKIKIGNYNYGGWDYWEKFSENSDTLTSSPIVTTNDREFDFINESKFRSGTSFEIDFLSYNFLEKYQNKVDITLGLGYKLRKPNKKVLIPYDDNNIQENWFDDDSKLFYNPLIHNLNINTNFIFQISKIFYPYYNFSYGFVQSYLFENSEGDLSIKGEGHSIGHAIGFNFISSVENKNYDLHYGIEFRFDEFVIDQISDLSANISKIEMREIGINFNIGIGYGGKNTIGDVAYSQMINSNYIEAIENFNFFKNKYPNHPRKKIADKMILFSENKIAYQMFNNGKKEYDKGHIDKAIIWFKKAINKSKNNKLLSLELESRKFLIANKLLDDLDNYQKSHTDKQTLDYLDFIVLLSDRIKSKALVKKIGLLNEKADFFIIKKDYKSAYDIYNKNKISYLENSYIYNAKMNILISLLINQTNEYIDKKDFIMAYENSIFLNKIYNASDDILNDNIKALKIELDKKRNKRIGEISLSALKNVTNEFLPKNNTYKIVLGDNLNKVIRLLGNSNEVKKREFLDSQYQLSVYSIENKKFKLYFKDKTLFEIEELK